MKKVQKMLKLLKINILSIIALPILLVATAGKLIAKGLERFAAIIGMSCFTLLLYGFFEALKSPHNVLAVIAFVIVFSLLVAIVVLIIRFCLALVVSAWSFVVTIFNVIYEYAYLGYRKLYDICAEDYHALDEKADKSYALPCLFYSLLRGVNTAIAGFVSISFYLSIGLSVLLVVGSLIRINGEVKTVLGINLFAFLSKFDTFSLVYGIAMYLAVMATMVITLLSLGIEWHKWAMELKMSGEEYSAYVKQIQENELQTEAAASNEYLEKVSEHLAQIDTLEEAVNNALSLNDNPLLRSSWSEYLRSLTDITGTCNAHDGSIPMPVLRKLIPQIRQLDNQRETIKKLLARQKSSTFFAGCDTPEKLEKRYKALCRAYHPDSEGGDEETFKALQAEYEQLRK